MNKLLTLSTSLIVLATLAWCSLSKKPIETNSWSTSLPAADENTIHGCLMWGGKNCDIIMNPANKTTYGETIKKVCDMMPMAACKTYFSKWSSTSDHKDMSGHTMNHADMVQSEFDFITLMIPHHQEAVDTSTTLLKTTTKPDLIALASGIVAGQAKEIQMMQWWLAQRYSGMKYEGMWYMPMMRSTTGLTPEQTDKQWTEDMIVHHQWAVDMAKKLIEIMNEKDQFIKTTAEWAAFREDLRRFANNIIKTQTKEIYQMKQILNTK